MIKVMVINSLYHPNVIGGAEKSTRAIVSNLGKFDIEPVVVTVSDRDRIDTVDGIRVYYVRHSSIYWSYYSKAKNNILKLFWHLLSLYNPFMLNRVKRIIKKEKPDIVHTNNLSEFTVGLWRLVKKNNIPLIHTLRDFSLLCPRATLFRRNQVCSKKNIICALMLKFRRSFSDLPDVVTGNSSFILDKHIESGFFKHADKYVIYNSLQSGDIGYREKENTDPDFGYLGLLAYHKGIEFLLDTFSENRLPGLHIFGRGITSEYEEYLASKYSSDRIIFHGFTETRKALDRIDVLIVPSLCLDALPRVIYEAYSAGIPVISSDRGGGKEIIEEGITGYVYNADSQSDLVRKIEMFTADASKVQKMRENCLRKARDFLPEKSVRQYADIYKRLAK
jgi:glycosyltransferase involved in cell wall biosynthesis